MAWSLKRSQGDTVEPSDPGSRINIVDNEKSTAKITTAIASSAEHSSLDDNHDAKRPFHDWFHWHEPGTSKEEKVLIFKIDWSLLSFSCLSFFIKQLDGNNVSNAYVSGMKGDLGFGPGNELSWMNTYFNIGTIIGGPCSNMMLTIVRPRYWLPGYPGACCYGPSSCSSHTKRTRHRSCTACGSASASSSLQPGRASNTCLGAGTGSRKWRGEVASSSCPECWDRCSRATSRPGCTRAWTGDWG